MACPRPIFERQLGHVDRVGDFQRLVVQLTGDGAGDELLLQQAVGLELQRRLILHPLMHAVTGGFLGQQALLDYVLRVGVDGKPPLYVDGTKQTFPARPQQFTLGVGAQIPGFDEAVLDMKVGETRTVIVPPKLGYGANGTEGFDDKIPKDATLIYTLELKSLLPFAPTDAQQKWIADHPNPWET